MRVDRLGAWITATFLVAGLALCVLAWILLTTTDKATIAGTAAAFIGIPWLIGSLVAIGMAIRRELRGRRRLWLARHGVLGRATIIEGTTEPPLEGNRRLDLVLEIEVPGEASRRIEHRCVVGSFAARRIRAGMVLPVYANPARPDEILLVW